MHAQHKTRDVDDNDNDAIKSVEYEQRKTEKDEHRASKIPSSGMVKRSHFKQINQNFTSIRALWTHSLTHTNKNPPAKTFISESGPHENGGEIHNNCDNDNDDDDVNEILYEYVKTFALQSI